jgi:hypothetical protein
VSPSYRPQAPELSDAAVRRLGSLNAWGLETAFGSIGGAVRLYRLHEDRVLRRCSTYVPPVAMVAAGADPAMAFTPTYDPRDPEQVSMVLARRRQRDAWIAEHAPDLHRYQRTKR